ncbi:acyltransferase family protein [Moorena sp. SIO4E2]|uniref:acyltransferase family protein n=1 Tax=Moorena sp. SIO4E2 TaxID=2607826 RepID=UPI00338E76E9
MCLLIFAITFKNDQFIVLDKIAAFGKYSYGIYLIHILFVEGLQDIANFFNISGTIVLDLGVFLLSLMLTMQTIFILRKLNLQEWLGT